MYSVVLTEEQQSQLFRHLVRKDGQEDLCFALYQLSSGIDRKTAVIKQLIFPRQGDRLIHGNVSFTPAYMDRVTSAALKSGCGICFMHSHPAIGWQDMSSDDIKAELYLAPRVKGITGLPLVGMTIGEDGFWSARFWPKVAAKTYQRTDCHNVRVCGTAFRIYFHPSLLPKLQFDDSLIRTISAWGTEKQESIARLKIGIVGLGSVGSIIAEALVKIGARQLSLIDFDIVKRKNLDRLNGIGLNQIGQLKVEAIKQYLLSVSANPAELAIQAIPFSIAEREGLLAALDCDLLISCVDRPWPRFILNSITYGNYIPVIDGGIDCSPNKRKDNLGQARWKAHAVAPGRRCLCCLGQYTPEDVALEQSGLLEDPHYIKDLPADHFIHRGENVYAFSLHLAGMEMQQLLSMLLQPNGQYVGPKEYNFNSGTVDNGFLFSCNSTCIFSGGLLGQGDQLNKHLIMPHAIAETTRIEAQLQAGLVKSKWYQNLFNWIISKIKNE